MGYRALLNGSVFRAPEKISVNAQTGVSLIACGFLGAYFVTAAENEPMPITACHKKP